MRRISFVLLLASVVCTSGVGCATTVRPVAKPIDPVPVFLSDYGVHSSLMLPTSGGTYVEYSFGDYAYAALNRNGPHNALGALLVSGQAAIGRRFLTMRPGEDAPRPAYAPKSFQKFYAERFQVSTLVKELDERYRAGTARSEPVHNPITDTVFVKDKSHYSIANNCNHMTARLMRQLGCHVRGNPGTSRFKVIGKQLLPPTPADSGGTVIVQAAPISAARSTPPAGRTPARKSGTPPAARSASYTKLDMN